MSEYEKQAKDFLRKTGCELKIEYTGDVEGFPFNAKDHMMHRAYKCTLVRDSNNLRRSCRLYEFQFYGSAADYEKGVDPTEYDVLSCLETYCPDTIDEFVAEYGYEVHEWADVRRIEETYKAIKDQCDHLHAMFSELELDILAEIN